jgi:hypothetical protein
MTHDEYLERRAELYKIRTTSEDSFDKVVLSLATGCLALSITFLDKIGKPFDAYTYHLIFAVWISFFAVIVANLVSFCFAKWNMDRKIQELDTRYRNEIQSLAPEESAAEETSFWQRTATAVCNMIALVAFFVGTLCFVLYIMAVQDNNFTNMRQKEDSIMDIKKVKAGITEIQAPVAKNRVQTEGRTELPAAIPRVNTITRGETEAPQAVQKPTPPPAPKDSTKK